MPAMIVCPVSSSVRTRNDGSSIAELLQRRAELLLVGLGLRLDGDVDDRLGELHPLQDDRVLLVAERVAGGGELQAHHRADVAGVALVNLLALVGAHLHQAADALALALRPSSRRACPPPAAPSRRG